MQTVTPLHPGHYYHIYNRGNNGENLFREERNYAHFLKLYAQHVYPIADLYAYCLMRNHFHMLVRIKETSQVFKTCEVLKPGEELTPRKVSQQFSNWFNAYTKSINKAYGRTGSLFEERFGRIEVTSERYFANLVFYIHLNPQKHGFVPDFREWAWSSYQALRSARDTKLERAQVLDWFGGAAQFDEVHRGLMDEARIRGLVDKDLL